MTVSGNPKGRDEIPRLAKVKYTRLVATSGHNNRRYEHHRQKRHDTSCDTSVAQKSEGKIRQLTA